MGLGIKQKCYLGILLFSVILVSPYLVPQIDAAIHPVDGITSLAPEGYTGVVVGPTAVATDGTWFEFATNGGILTGCTPADPAGPSCTPSSGTPTSFAPPPPWTFFCGGTCSITVTDAFINDDTFDVFDSLALIGTTSTPGGGNCGNDPEVCLADANASSGVFALAAGSHSITISHVAGDPNVGGAHYFKVLLTGPDTTPPETTIDSNSQGLSAGDPSNVAAITYAFSSNEPGVTFECSDNGAAFAPCTSGDGQTATSQGNTTFEVRATDASANTDLSPASFNWTFDNISPVVTGSVANITPAGNTELVLANTYPGTCTAVDINPASPTCTVQSGSIDNSVLGAQSVTYEATDDAGNTGTDTVTTTLVDNTLPTIAPPTSFNPFELELANSFTGATAEATITDNNKAVNNSKIAPNAATLDTSVLGSQTALYDFDDPSGNSAAQASTTYVVTDTTLPTIEPPVSINPFELELVNSFTGATAEATITDNDKSVNGDKLAPTSGAIDTSELGSQTANYDFTDPSGNAAVSSSPAASTTYVVTDTTNPVLTVNADQREEADTAIGATISFTTDVTATDNDKNFDTDNDSADVVCEDDTTPTPISVSQTGGIFTLGTTTVTCTATDFTGNSSVDDFVIAIADVHLLQICVNGVSTGNVEICTAVDPDGTPTVTVDARWGASDEVKLKLKVWGQNTPTDATGLTATWGNNVDTSTTPLTAPQLATLLAGDEDAGTTVDVFTHNYLKAASGGTENVKVEMFATTFTSNLNANVAVQPHDTTTVVVIEDVDGVDSFQWGFEFDVDATITDDDLANVGIPGLTVKLSGNSLDVFPSTVTMTDDGGGAYSAVPDAVGAGGHTGTKDLDLTVTANAAYIFDNPTDTVEILKHTTLVTMGTIDPTSVLFDYDFEVAGTMVDDTHAADADFNVNNGTLNALNVSYTGPGVANGLNVAQPLVFTLTGNDPGTTASTTDDVTSAGEGSPGGMLAFTVTFAEDGDFFGDSDGGMITTLPHDTILVLNPFTFVSTSQTITPAGLLIDTDRNVDVDTGNVDDLSITFSGNGTSEGDTTAPGTATTDDTIIDDPNNTAVISSCPFSAVPNTPGSCRDTRNIVEFGLNSTITLPDNIDTIALEIHDLDSGDWVQFNFTQSSDMLEYRDVPKLSSGNAPDSVYYSLTRTGGIDELKFANATAGITTLKISVINATNTTDNPAQIYEHNFASDVLGTFETTELFVKRGQFHENGTSSSAPLSNLKIVADFAGNSDYGSSTSNDEFYYVIEGGGGSGAGIGGDVEITEDSGTGFTATICGSDKDGDFICDLWDANNQVEYSVNSVVKQFPIPDSEFNDGTVNTSFFKKDIYLEIDRAKGMIILDQALNDVVNAFDIAPVPASLAVGGGELPGINLHIIVDEEIGDTGNIGSATGEVASGDFILDITAWKDDNTVDDVATANYDDFTSIKNRHVGFKEWRATVTAQSDIFSSPGAAQTAKTLFLFGLTVDTPPGLPVQDEIEGTITARVRVDFVDAANIPVDVQIIGWGTVSRSGGIPVELLNFVPSSTAVSASPTSASNQKDFTITIPYIVEEVCLCLITCREIIWGR